MIARHRLLYRVWTGLSVVSAMALAAGCLGETKPAHSPSPATLAASASLMTPLPVQGGPGIQATGLAVAVPEGVPPTLIVEYTPEKPGGQARSGSCWTNSLAVPSRDAWRCNVGSETLDPCFALGNGEVTCNPNPLTGFAGKLVRLSEPLPKPDLIAERASIAWLLELEDHTVCNLATGATGVVNGKRISYVCSPAGSQESKKVVILGDPILGSVWMVEKAVVSPQNGKLAAETTGFVPLRTVVRGPAAFVPLACDPLAETLADLLGTEVRRTEAPFLDQITGDKGSGCQASATVAMVNPAVSAVDLVRRMLANRGWQEDLRYQSTTAGRSATAFRKEGALCLLDATSKPSGVTWSTTPQVATIASPHKDQSQYMVTLNCAQERSATSSVESSRPRPLHINFEPGATADSIQRPIASTEIQEYVLYAFAGQTMIVEVASPSPDVFFSLAGQSDGVPLVRASDNAKRWVGRLSATQNYLIKVINRGDDAAFNLKIVIPAALNLSPEGLPALATGTLEPGQSRHYIIAGATGQRTNINLDSPDLSASFVVYGLEDEKPLTSVPAKATSWTGEFPRAQDYVVEVTSGDVGGKYTLKVDEE